MSNMYSFGIREITLSVEHTAINNRSYKDIKLFSLNQGGSTQVFAGTPHFSSKTCQDESSILVLNTNDSNYKNREQAMKPFQVR